MKTILILAGLVALGGVQFAQRVAVVRAADMEIDYQKTADGAEWKWSDKATDPFYCSLRQSSAYAVAVIVPASQDVSRLGLFIEIRKDDKPVFKFPANANTVFAIKADRLTYVDFSPHNSGGKVVQVDLTSGKERWQSPMSGVAAGGAFFNYVTRFNLELPNDDVLFLWGNESAGRYFEIKSMETGQTVGHKVFPGDANEEKKR
jgi:hypothetical protein